ncbi:MAG: lipo-like protein [Proteobacteria bacterium]|nr:lipo-like protein [Pseudomonadota bacterium]
MNRLLGVFGTWLARYLSAPRSANSTAITTSAERLQAVLQPADVLVVEGNTRLSTAIKYLTQSTWSHAALYVGSHLAERGGNPPHCFVEADAVLGVRSVGIEEYRDHHVRICRPLGLNEQERRAVTNYAITRIGYHYDLRNVVDLARYLLPTPPVPPRFRRRMLALGSGDPTRAICSTLIAQAFQSIRYPILPLVDTRVIDSAECPGCVEEILHVRHHSLYTPRDFDVSPYFEVIKPTIAAGFDFHTLNWAVDEVESAKPLAVPISPRASE